MLHVLCDVLGVVLTGIVIKLMDDMVDREPESLADRLDRAIVPYLVLLAVLAVSLAHNIVVPLFFASYACGMVWDGSTKQPFQASGHGEIIIAVLTSALITSIRLTAAALCTILSVQIVDDYVDLSHDYFSSRQNFVIRLGKSASIMLLVVLLAWGCYFNMRIVLYTFLCLPVVEGVVKWGSTKY